MRDDTWPIATDRMTAVEPGSRTGRLRILLLHKQLLFPRDTGAKIRLLNLLLHLPKWHDLTFVCHIRPAEEQHIPDMQALGLRLETVPVRESRHGSPHFLAQVAANILSPHPFTIDRHFDPALRARIHTLLDDEPYDLLICDTPHLARNVWGIRTVPKILFERNVEAQILERHVAHSTGWARRLYMSSQWRRMRRFESTCGTEFDTVIAVSDLDQRTFQQTYGWQHVRPIDTAVDLGYFTPRPENDNNKHVLFIGSLDWLPNADGVAHFVRNIWPLVRRQHPDAVFRVVGRSPSARLRRTCAQVGVELIGGVPDIRAYLAQATVVVVPLLVGGGTRIKIFEAMAMKRAVVSTTLGAEGLPVQHGRHLLLADEPAAFAASIGQLLNDAQLRRRLADSGHDLVNTSYSTEAIARQFERICLDTVHARHSSVPYRQAVA